MASSNQMPSANATPTSLTHRKIQYLSPPADVSMADSWFEVATLSHFWVRRRFQVLLDLAGDLISASQEMAEIGCGHGLLQRQIEDEFGREVTGFDLNEFALRQNISRRSTVCCYDIFHKDPQLQARYDVVFLFDVLEHIIEQDSFLAAALFHLKPGGKLILNVPAGQWAFSAYDVAAGHVRRYLINTLQETAFRNGLSVWTWTYWGLPLVPALVARKLWLLGNRDPAKIIHQGFDSRSAWVNKALETLAGCEVIPQKFLGTSLMAVLNRGTKGEQDARR